MKSCQSPGSKGSQSLGANGISQRRVFRPAAGSTPPKSILDQCKSFLSTSKEENATPLNIEIGCGVGMHAIKFAQKHPSEKYLAIERTKNKFQKFSGRLAHHQLSNLLGVHAEAAILLPHLLESKCIDRLFILYPNPYPKESQKNLRWAHSNFFDFLMTHMKPQGEVFFATNLDFYKDELLHILPKVFHFKTVDCHRLTGPSAHPLTHFEKKYLARGESCWHIRFKLD